MTARTSAPSVALFLALALTARAVPPGGSAGFARAVSDAEAALKAGDLAAGQAAVERALERDPKSARAWDLEARRAELANERDELVHALHREHALLIAQKGSPAQLSALHARILAEDPVAKDLFAFGATYVKKLGEVALAFEKQGWAHAAIAAHRQILALDPENEASRAAIETLAAAPDPSLAADARPVDLLAGISDEWIAEHDRDHADWDHRATLEREHYVTRTDAGYVVLVRAAEAMERMSAFYRDFFALDAKRLQVPRIDVRIYKDRDGYLAHGKGPPVPWSGGQFAGDAVEVYVGPGGFEQMVGSLFHEAAHQYVPLAASPAKWLNEGLASFFEGSRILANGTVITNLPANHRLFPLVERMECGWMASATDGGSASDPTVVPPKAPTFRMVLEGSYAWAPAWYGPTWGAVYFLHNFQDPVDGRFVYRKAFREYVERAGGLTGSAASEAFERLVLAHPCAPTAGQTTSFVAPKTLGELDGPWKEWLVRLRDEQAGRLQFLRPWKDWAAFAVQRGDLADAEELYEKGLDATPDDVRLLVGFGALLAGQKHEDRAVQLFRRAEARLAGSASPDAALAADVDRWLRKLDPQVFALRKLRVSLAADAKALVARYLEQGFLLQAMELSWRLGREFALPELERDFRSAVEQKGRSLATWKLAYDEEDLHGWNDTGEPAFVPAGEELVATNPAGPQADRRFLTLDQVAPGDFSFETEIQAAAGSSDLAGLVFGRKAPGDFHALVLYPPTAERNGFVHLETFHGGTSQLWHQVELSAQPADAWHRLRIDVTESVVDVWFDGTPLVSQQFSGSDALRGSSGLVAGVGRTKFRNVRLLTREPGDPSAELERAARMKALAGTAAANQNGSWMGQVPPFPRVGRWVQEPRTSWEERRGVPQLLVLWGTSQNTALPIDTWLTALAQKHADIGLAVLGVVSPWDDQRLLYYLRDHPFPGSVAIDAVENGSEATFGLYQIERFGLPRMLLLDVDGTVLWEGNPGFEAHQLWNGEESYCEGQIQSLISRRKLAEVVSWKKAWRLERRSALESGDFARFVELLRGSAALDADLYPEVADARAKLAQLEEIALAPAATLAALAAQGREAALDPLVRWAEIAGHPLAASREQKALESSAGAKDWARALGFLKPALRKLGEGKPAEVTEAALAQLAKLSGAFPAELTADLAAARGDAERTKQVLLGAESRPARWLAETHFAW